MTKGIRQTNIHAKIKGTMSLYFTKIGWLQISRIMNLAGITWDDMPTLAKYKENGVNTLCYNFVLGKCNPRYCTHKGGHAPAADISDEFAE